MRKIITGFKQGFKCFGENISALVNSMLLAFVYIVGVGLTSMIAKIIGKRFLDTEISKYRKTYWTSLNLEKKAIEKYYRQF